MVISRTRRGLPISDDSTLEDINFPPVKFVVFPTILGSKEKVLSQENFELSLYKVFTTDQNPRKTSSVVLTDENLSAALEHLFRKATDELIEFNNFTIIQICQNWTHVFLVDSLHLWREKG